MADIPIPFTGEKVDTDDGVVPIAMTLAALIAGFGILTMAQRAGANLFGTANSFVQNTLGIQLDGSDGGPGGV